jgi:hypothetical protein
MKRQSKRKHRVLWEMREIIDARKRLDALAEKLMAARRSFSAGMAQAYAQMRADPEWQERNKI